MKHLKKYKVFELNTTINGDEILLNRNFGIESDIIKDWFQDLLDEWIYLDFEIEVISDKYFSIIIKDTNSINESIPGIIDKNLHIISDDKINFINSQLNYYDLKLKKQLSGEFTYYIKSNQYLELMVEKIPTEINESQLYGS
jgi:hypothetical protein